MEGSVALKCGVTETPKNESGVEGTLQESSLYDSDPSPIIRNFDYEESVIISEQGLRSSKVLPVYTLDWASRADPFFTPVTGLDFLVGVPKVVMLQTTIDLSSTESTLMIKIPNGETLYLGLENSKSIQRALFCSQRSFHMTFLDPNKQEAASFHRKGAFTNFATFFQQELEVFIPEKDLPIGRLIQDRGLSSVSFSILDQENKILYKIVGSKPSYLWNLHHNVYFTVLDPVNRTGGLIVHKMDSCYKDFVYHITFPATDTSSYHKMLIIGAALLVEYTYFKKTGCFGGSS